MRRQSPQSLFTMLKLAGRFILCRMKTPYNKHFTSPHDLVSLLKSRGLEIKNEEKATAYIANIGYYRLSSYFYPLLQLPKSEHIYKANATFDLVINMYRFDRKLRMLLFNEIEKIEVAIRSTILNVVTEELNDVFWMTNPENFHNQTTFAKTINLIQSEKDKTKEEFIAHFHTKYSDHFPPVWMIAEVIPFGTLGGIFNNLKSAKLKKKVSARFGLSAPVFSSWIIALVNLRNLCCHHSRTWNREIAVVPVGSYSFFFTDCLNKFFSVLLGIATLGLIVYYIYSKDGQSSQKAEQKKYSDIIIINVLNIKKNLKYN